MVAASSGNHAQALALRRGAARRRRRRSSCRRTRPASKAAATEGYGARIVRFDRYADDREALMAAWRERDGLTIVHPYDDERVMAGQGTAALELLEDGGPLDLLLVPVGGGGLIAGCATAADGALPGVPRDRRGAGGAATTRARSLAAGERVRVPVGRTIADGQQLDQPGERTFPVIRARVAAVVTVSDAEIVEAMRFAFERLKLVLEPSGASALAALLHGQVERRRAPHRGHPVGRERRRRAVSARSSPSLARHPHRDPHRLHLRLAPRRPRTARAPCSPRWPRPRAARSSRWRSCRTTSR